jgi:hypothetical protein
LASNAITIVNAGTYNIYTSIVIGQSGTSTIFYLWLRVNGLLVANDIPNSNIQTQLSSSADHQIMSNNIIYNANAGDTITLWWQNSSGTGLIRQPLNTPPSTPVTPTIKVEISQIVYTGTTGPTGATGIQGPVGSGSSITIASITTAAIYYPTFTNATSGLISTLNISSARLTYNPNTNVLTLTGGTTNSITATTFIGALTGTATNATNVTQTVNNGLTTSYILFSNSATNATNVPVYVATRLGYNSTANSLTLTGGSLNSITATTFNGALSGTATNATNVLQTVNNGLTTSYILFSNSAANATNVTVYVATNLIYNSTTNSLSLTASGLTNSITATTFTGALTGTATNATNVLQTVNNGLTTSYILFSNSASNATNVTVYVATRLGYNSTTNVLTLTGGTLNAITATTFTGALTGNASTATTAATATNISQTLTSTQTVCNPVLTTSGTTSASNPPLIDSNFTYNASTNTLTVPNIASALTGNVTGTASLASDLAGGLIGELPYQSAVNVTTFLAAGTSGSVLKCNGAAAPSWVAASLLGFTVTFSGYGAIGNYLQPNKFYDSTVPLGPILTAAQNATKYVIPTAATITGYSWIVQTISTTGTMSIMVNGVAQTTSATFTAATGVVSGLTISAGSGAYIEVRTNTAVIGQCSFTLLFG